MNFENIIKNLRKKEKITQEEMASKLNITRQAISNWENGRNLPDIEMLIIISKTFNISLDNLILGREEREMNDITKKIINDGSKNKRAKLNLYSVLVGSFLLLIGIICFIIKANSIEYIDEEGFLHENFFLIPIGFLFLFIGTIVILVSSIKYIKDKNN